MRIITRAEWQARAPKSETPLALPTAKLILHHSASPSGGASRVRAIQDFHMDIRGWNDIAYHFLINHRGEIYEGRPTDVRGGATSGHNSDSHAICLLGNFDTATPSPEALASLVWLIQQFDVWPPTISGGHRDYGDTSCPGNNLYPLIGDINRELEDTLPTAEEIADAVWSHNIQSGITAALALDRNYRNISELIIAHRAGKLGTTALAELSDEDIEEIAEAVADEQARRLID